MDATLLQEFKKSLTEERDRLINELKRFAKPTDNPENFETRMTDMGTDEEDNASEVEEFVGNLGLEDNLEKHLKAVDAALIRIENGTYGTCDNCKGAISVERLRAYPAANTCLECTPASQK